MYLFTNHQEQSFCHGETSLSEFPETRSRVPEMSVVNPCVFRTLFKGNSLSYGLIFILDIPLLSQHFLTDREDSHHLNLLGCRLW